MIQALTALVVALTTLVVGRWLLLVGKLDDLAGAVVQLLLIFPRLVGALLSAAGLYGGAALGGDWSVSGLLPSGWPWLLAAGVLAVGLWAWRAEIKQTARRTWRKRRPQVVPVTAPPPPEPSPDRPTDDFETLMRRIGRRPRAETLP